MVSLISAQVILVSVVAQQLLLKLGFQVRVGQCAIDHPFLNEAGHGALATDQINHISIG